MKEKRKTRCPVCGIFQKDGWTVENPADEPSSSSFPEEFHKLELYRMVREGTSGGYYEESIRICPECGLLYEYSCRLPGGSYDAMRTWVVERLEPLMKNGKHVKKQDPSPNAPERGEGKT